MEIEREEVETTGQYCGVMIYLMRSGRMYVEYVEFYQVKDLCSAKSLIDDLISARAN